MIYQPLTASRREIRVLVVEPGNFAVGEEIRCTLQVVSLDQEPLPKFEALSYVWGDEQIGSSIIVQGEVKEVTPNLNSALRHLRRSHDPRTIWADAVCINQDDVTERNSQVALMGEIYRQAGSSGGVVVWLGESSVDSDVAFAALEAMGADPGRHWISGSAAGMNPMMSIPADDLCPESVQAVSNILCRPWWYRLWTVQESVIPEKLSFMCGHQVMSSASMFTAAANFFQHSTTCCYGMAASPDGAFLLRTLRSGFATTLMLRQYREIHRGLNMLELISTFRSRHCRDSKDKVYAPLGLLANSCHAGLVQPDYTKSVREIFEQTAVELIKRSNNLQVFCLLFPLDESQSQSAAIQNLPSWVPDWTIKGSEENFRDLHIRMEHFALYAATGTTKMSIRHPQPGQLVVRAAILGTISRLSDTRGSGETRAENEIYKSWRQVAGVDGNEQRTYPLRSTNQQTSAPILQLQTQAFSDAYMLTLCASVSRALEPSHPTIVRDVDTLRRIHDTWWTWVVRYDRDAMKASVLQAEHGVSLNQLGSFVVDVTVATGMRRLFLTDEGLGLIGLAPRSAQEADSIALIEGCPVPVLVRENTTLVAAQGGSGKTWMLLGTCYVHGIMQGEGQSLGTMREMTLV